MTWWSLTIFFLISLVVILCKNQYIPIAYLLLRFIITVRLDGVLHPFCCITWFSSSQKCKKILTRLQHSSIFFTHSHLITSYERTIGSYCSSSPLICFINILCFLIRLRISFIQSLSCRSCAFVAASPWPLSFVAWQHHLNPKVYRKEEVASSFTWLKPQPSQLQVRFGWRGEVRWRVVT